jgi:hypothetical protein
MRSLYFSLILLCVLGCASNRYYVRADGRQTVILDEDRRSVTDQVAYVADYEELRALKHPYLEYVGTKDDYHIVFWWMKISPGPSAVFTFAVPKDQFLPARPFKFEGIKPYTPSQYLFDL